MDADSLDPEDAKLVALARSARARNGTPEGAAVRDGTGRTYVATTVALRTMELSAIRVAIAMAVSSGSTGLEAVALVGASGPDPADLSVIAEVGAPAGVRIVRADPTGTVRSVDAPA